MNANRHHQHEEHITAAGRDWHCLFRREVGGGYRVTCPELPPLLAFGDTLDDARENARDEIEAWLDRDDGRELLAGDRRRWCWPDRG